MSLNMGAPGKRKKDASPVSASNLRRFSSPDWHDWFGVQGSGLTVQDYLPLAEQGWGLGMRGWGLKCIVWNASVLHTKFLHHTARILGPGLRVEG